MPASKSPRAAKAAKATKATKATKAAKSPARHGNPWTAADMKQLRELARRATPTRVAAQQLGRSLDSVKSKASEEGISFKPTKRASAARKRSR